MSGTTVYEPCRVGGRGGRPRPRPTTPPCCGTPTPVPAGRPSWPAGSCGPSTGNARSTRLDPANGDMVQSFSLGSEANHFPTPTRGRRARCWRRRRTRCTPSTARPGSRHPRRPAPPRPGYWTTASDGGVFSFGGGGFAGSMGGRAPGGPGGRHGRHLRRRRATGWWRPTAGSSPSVTPATSAPWGAHLLANRWWAWRLPPTGRVLDGGARRRGLRLRGRRLLRVDGRAARSPPRGRAWPPPPTAAATGWWPRTAGCSPSATPASHGSMGGRPPRPSPWSAWRPRPAAATGWWRRTAASSPSAAPGSSGPWAGGRWPSPSWA